MYCFFFGGGGVGGDLASLMFRLLLSCANPILSIYGVDVHYAFLLRLTGEGKLSGPHFFELRRITFIHL